MQVPSTCSRHFPAAVNTPVLNDSSTMSGMSLIQLPRGLPGCPVLDNKPTERSRKISLRGTALKNPTRSSFHSTSSSSLGLTQCLWRDFHS